MGSAAGRSDGAPKVSAILSNISSLRLATSSSSLSGLPSNQVDRRAGFVGIKS